MSHCEEPARDGREDARVAARELQALRYISGEMSCEESTAFEATLGEDVALCEMVADLVRVTRTIAAAETVLHRSDTPSESGAFAVTSAGSWADLSERLAFWRRLAAAALTMAASVVAVSVWPWVFGTSDASGRRGGIAAKWTASRVEAARVPAVSEAEDFRPAANEVAGGRGEEADGASVGTPVDRGAGGEDALLAAAWVRLLQAAEARDAIAVVPSGIESVPDSPSVAVSAYGEHPATDRFAGGSGVSDTDPDGDSINTGNAGGELRLPEWIVLAVAGESAESSDDEAWH